MKYVCENCNVSFEKHGRGRPPRFCSDECRREWWAKNADQKKMYTLSCEYCGKTFESHLKRQRFCSYECSGKSNRTLKGTTKECANCGKIFAPTHKGHKYCSSKCASEAQRKYYTCKECGKEFRLRSGGKGIFCSRECSFKYIHDHRRGRTKRVYIPKEKKTVLCEICNKEFDTNLPGAKYCSDECRKIANRLNWRIYSKNKYISKRLTSPYVVKICSQCGKSFKINYRVNQSKFCSQRCCDKFHNEKREEQLKKAFVSKVNFRELYMRDKGICQICGEPVAYDKSPENPMGATIDHIIPLSKGGKHHMGNCQLAHRRCNSIKGDKLPEYIKM